MRSFAKAVSFSGLLAVTFAWSGMALAECVAVPSPGRTAKSLLSAENAGALLLGPIVGEANRPSGWTSVRDLDRHCYRMPEDWRYRELKFAVNNHLADPPKEKEARFDLGLQIIKIRLRQNEPVKDDEEITAYRSDKYSWYRNGRPSASYSGSPRSLDLSLSDWNDAHAPGNVIEQNDRKLGGRFHASPSQQGRNTFQERRWWRLNERLAKDYQLRLEYRLLSALPAAGMLAGGIPFQVRARGADAIIIRYKSTNADIDNDVTLCFSACEAIEKLDLRGANRDLLAVLFPWRR